MQEISTQSCFDAQVFRGIKNGVQPVAVKVLAQSDDMQLSLFAKVSKCGADKYCNDFFNLFLLTFGARLEHQPEQDKPSLCFSLFDLMQGTASTRSAYGAHVTMLDFQHT